MCLVNTLFLIKLRIKLFCKFSVAVKLSLLTLKIRFCLCLYDTVSIAMEKFEIVKIENNK